MKSPIRIGFLYSALLPWWLLVASPAVAAAPATVSIDGTIEVAAGESPAANVSPEAAKGVIEPAFGVIGKCAEGEALEGEAAHKVTLEVDAEGAVTKVERVESKLTDAVASCVDARLGELKMPSGPAKVTVGLRLTPAPKPAVAPEPPAAPGVAPGAPVASGSEPGGAKPAGEEEEKLEGADHKTATNLRVLGDAALGHGKKWRVFGTLDQYVGSGAFLSDSNAAAPQYGYAVTLRGTYRLSDFLHGINASVRADFSQQLTKSNQDGGTLPRQFLFRETRLGLSIPSIYTEPTTNVRFGTTFGIALPTDLAGQAAERIMGTTIGASATKTFEKLGPGDLTLTYAASFRKNWGPRSPTLAGDEASSAVAACRSANKEAGECITSFASSNYSITNNATAAYTIGDWTLTVDFILRNTVFNALNSSELPPSLQGGRVGRSPNATDGALQDDLNWATVELGYTINDMFSLAVGTYTATNPFIQSGSSSSTFRFPFWDFNSEASNLTNVYFDVNFTY